MTPDLSDAHTTAGAISLLSFCVSISHRPLDTAPFSRLHRALYNVQYTLNDAYRSIRAGVSGRYAFIPPVKLRVHYSVHYCTI